MKFTAKLVKNKSNGQLNFSLPKRKLKLKKTPKFIEIKQYKFID